jgi:RHS repeat-associated protein
MPSGTGNRITREVDGGNIAYVHTDQLGQPQMLTDASKAVVWDRVARPFGATAAETGTTAVALRFPGQWADAESGYHYNYQRDYDPSIGRYLQSDPIGLAGGRNRYAYVGGNPQNLTDRTGQCLEDLCIVEGMILAAAIDLAIQLYDNDGRLECIDWGQTAWSAGLGALPIGGILNRFGRGLLPYFVSRGIGWGAREAAERAAARGARNILPRPTVSSQKLQNIVDNLYKGTTNPNRVGTGTTADAIRHELATGQLVGGKSHLQKGTESIRALENWLMRNPDAAYRDQLVARSLIGDLLDATGGVRWAR